MYEECVKARHRQGLQRIGDVYQATTACMRWNILEVHRDCDTWIELEYVQMYNDPRLMQISFYKLRTIAEPFTAIPPSGVSAQTSNLSGPFSLPHNFTGSLQYSGAKFL
jgi:hypothetical protein